jgi:hypothetical protein
MDTRATIGELLDKVISMRAMPSLYSEHERDFRIPYVYDYITKLCRTQAEVILNHVRGSG